MRQTIVTLLSSVPTADRARDLRFVVSKAKMLDCDNYVCDGPRVRVCMQP